MQRFREFAGSPLRFRIERWAWEAATAGCVAVYFLAPGLWQAASILYLAVVSNYALVLTLAGAEQAARAREAGEREVS